MELTPRPPLSSKEQVFTLNPVWELMHKYLRLEDFKNLRLVCENFKSQIVKLPAFKRSIKLTFTFGKKWELCDLKHFGEFGLQICCDDYLHLDLFLEIDPWKPWNSNKRTLLEYLGIMNHIGMFQVVTKLTLGCEEYGQHLPWNYYEFEVATFFLLGECKKLKTFEPSQTISLLPNWSTDIASITNAFKNLKSLRNSAIISRRNEEEENNFANFGKVISELTGSLESYIGNYLISTPRPFRAERESWSRYNVDIIQANAKTLKTLSILNIASEDIILPQIASLSYAGKNFPFVLPNPNLLQCLELDVHEFSPLEIFQTYNFRSLKSLKLVFNFYKEANEIQIWAKRFKWSFLKWYLHLEKIHISGNIRNEVSFDFNEILPYIVGLGKIKDVKIGICGTGKIHLEQCKWPKLETLELSDFGDDFDLSPFLSYLPQKQDEFNAKFEFPILKEVILHKDWGSVLNY